MKVCLLNDSFAPVIDGVVNVVINYAEHLIRDHGAEVSTEQLLVVVATFW